MQPSTETSADCLGPKAQSDQVRQGKRMCNQLSHQSGRAWFPLCVEKLIEADREIFMDRIEDATNGQEWFDLGGVAICVLLNQPVSGKQAGKRSGKRTTRMGVRRPVEGRSRAGSLGLDLHCPTAGIRLELMSIKE